MILNRSTHGNGYCSDGVGLHGRTSAKLGGWCGGIAMRLGRGFSLALGIAVEAGLPAVGVVVVGFGIERGKRE